VKTRTSGDRPAGKVASSRRRTASSRCRSSSARAGCARRSGLGRADAEKIRTRLKQREEELKKLQKDGREETYYSRELERERKRMKRPSRPSAAGIRDAAAPIKELEHRVAIRGAESDTSAGS